MSLVNYDARADSCGLSNRRRDMKASGYWGRLSRRSFHNICEMMFAGQVANLPTEAVYVACLSAGNGRFALECVTPETTDGATVYKVAHVLVAVGGSDVEKEAA